MLKDDGTLKILKQYVVSTFQRHLLSIVSIPFLIIDSILFSLNFY